MPQPVLPLLSALVFFDPLPSVNRELRDWLLLENSMTQRLAQHCQHITINVTRQGFTRKLHATNERPWLPCASRYWLREVILAGDNEPWLVARTLVPETTLCDAKQQLQQLQQLGDTPLGHYLFSHEQLTRDFIHIGRCNGLWGRRSRFQLSGNPLLLTELFLAASPVYHKESACNGV